MNIIQPVAEADATVTGVINFITGEFEILLLLNLLPGSVLAMVLKK